MYSKASIRKILIFFLRFIVFCVGVILVAVGYDAMIKGIGRDPEHWLFIAAFNLALIVTGQVLAYRVFGRLYLPHDRDKNNDVPPLPTIPDKSVSASRVLVALALLGSGIILFTLGTSLSALCVRYYSGPFMAGSGPDHYLQLAKKGMVLGAGGLVAQTIASCGLRCFEKIFAKRDKKISIN